MWRNGFSKPEVLKKPDAAFAYVMKYFLKQLSTETTKSNDPPIDKIWKLKGKRIVWFALPIRILAWSRGMQKLYQDQQRMKLVLRKNTQHKLSAQPPLPKILFRPLLRGRGLGKGTFPNS